VKHRVYRIGDRCINLLASRWRARACPTTGSSWPRLSTRLPRTQKVLSHICRVRATAKFFRLRGKKVPAPGRL